MRKDFIEVSVSSHLNKASQLGKALLMQQYRIPLSIYNVVIHGILQVLGTESVPYKGLPLVRALLFVSTRRLHPNGVRIFQCLPWLFGSAIHFQRSSLSVMLAAGKTVNI